MAIATSGGTKYERLAARVEAEIRRGGYRPGQALPSIRSLMSSDGLSMATVVKGLGELERRGLIHRMQGRGYFVSDRHRPHPELAQIALLTPALAGDTNTYVKGLSRVFGGSERFSLATYSTHSDLKQYQELIYRMAKVRPAGAVVTAVPRTLMELDYGPLFDAGIPVVAIGRDHQDLPCDRIDYHGGNSGPKLVPHLLERGAKGFAVFMVMHGSDPTRQELLSGIQNALAAEGIDLPNERVFTFRAPHGWMNPPNPCIDAQEEMRRILGGGRSFDTLICCHDYSAWGALLAILEAGIKVPSELRVASAARGGVSGLALMKVTTIEVYMEQQSETAGRLLLRRIEGYNGPPEVHYVAGDLVIGETT